MFKHYEQTIPGTGMKFRSSFIFITTVWPRGREVPSFINLKIFLSTFTSGLKNKNLNVKSKFFYLKTTLTDSIVFNCPARLLSQLGTSQENEWVSVIGVKENFNNLEIVLLTVTKVVWKKVMWNHLDHVNCPAFARLRLKHLDRQSFCEVTVIVISCVNKFAISSKHFNL